MLSPIRLWLCCRAVFWRWLISRWYLRDRRDSNPVPPKYSFKIRIPSSVSKSGGSFSLFFYTPPSYEQPLNNPRNSNPTQKLWPVVINFHGGGYTVGHAEDDARWAASVTSQDAVLISVDYRLAPWYPYPTAVEDCTSAILWVQNHGSRYNLDASRLILSGFSAGGALCFSSSYLLNTRILTGQNSPPPKPKGIISFYPGLDYTLTRQERDDSNPVAVEKSTIPAFLGDLYHAVYFYPKPENMAIPYISPGLAPSDVLRDALPDRLWLSTCAWDRLLTEGEAFRERLGKAGKVVTGGVVKEQVHAWDKVATYGQGNVRRDEVYGEALEEMIQMLKRELEDR